MKRDKSGTYSEAEKRAAQDTYNRTKKAKKQAHKEKTKRGWQNFKKGLSKAWDIGKTIVSGAAAIF